MARIGRDGGRGWIAAGLAAVVATMCACTSTVAGHAMRPTGQPAGPSTSAKPAPARELLLADGDRAPFGQVTQSRVGDNYFTSAVPPECQAALLFKDSPLRPPGSSDHAEAAYNVGGEPLYAESVDVYANTLNVHDVVWNAFRAVSGCHGDAVGVSPSGRSTPMRLNYFAIAADGVLVWTMSSPRWTCDYGLAVVSRAALVVSACDFQSGFPMAEWASQRRTQLDTRA
ncbi:hypothetical protein A4G26_07005 [Mycobacterium kansasii]|uniref:Lipoprotein LprH n=1 Tax=Mycobacterium innocens TaxID=2341083 RepID=A0A498PY01_9MYCO|nr:MULTISPECIES: hypothetical protein [Mycobacterium]KZS70253.1 hypothetical protein A4G26_07005 [Mycobacterium kansasii]VBA38616.1 Putative lipoprotein LprH [Mycobacterium innocens]